MGVGSGAGGGGCGAKGVVAVGKHLFRMIAGELLGLGAKIAEHGVRLPPANELDGFFVDVGTKKGSGTTGSQAVGLDTIRRDAGDVLDCIGSKTEVVRDVLGRDGPWLWPLDTI